MSVFYHTIYNVDNTINYSPAGFVLLGFLGLAILFYATKMHGPVEDHNEN